MDKPIILKVKETEENIVKIINESGIPAFILKTSIEKILTQLKAIEQQDLINAQKEYNDLIERENKKSGAKK